MKRPAPGEATEPLFDLPLDAPRVAPESPSTADAPEQMALESSEAPPPEVPSIATATAIEDRRPGSSANLYGRRWAAGILDLAAHLAVLASAVAGSWWLDVAPNQASIPPLTLFLVCFSFVYHVVPLTFWGTTPGMARTGLTARASDGGPLTISQAVKRWLGGLLNVASLGLAFAISRERSLADILSRSSVGDVRGHTIRNTS